MALSLQQIGRYFFIAQVSLIKFFMAITLMIQTCNNAEGKKSTIKTAFTSLNFSMRPAYIKPPQIQIPYFQDKESILYCKYFCQPATHKPTV